MIRYILFYLAISITVIGCRNDNIGPQDNNGNEPNLSEISTTQNTITQGSNDFGFSIFKNIASENSGNVFISPLSISTALATSLNGAEGVTQQSILNTINYKNLGVEDLNQGYKDLTVMLQTMDNKVELGIANSVWYNQGFEVNDDFNSIIQNYYAGAVQDLKFNDPNAKNVINNWVEEKTKNHIKNLIDNISPDEEVFLINAIYFKGDWTNQFDKSRTHDYPFTAVDGSTASVKMMFGKDVNVKYYSDSNLQVVDIPYGNEQFTLTVIMPEKPSELITLVNTITNTELTNWLTHAFEVKADLELPRFKMEWKNDIKKNLISMGMRVEPFTKILKNQELEISRVIHQTYIDVNEEGSEAAAATGVGMTLTSVSPDYRHIIIDKPFLFMIREKHSDAILFMGQLVDPASL